MGKFIDLTGQKFGKLTVIELHHKRKIKNSTRVYWLCKCDCGGETITRTDNLTSGATTSCGCVHLNILRTIGIKHNLSDSRLYKVYTSMIYRCYNKNNYQYYLYGSRGISVCEEWKKDFMNFYNWAMENGYNKNAKHGECTLDRIDVNGNYEPSNCRWINNKEQQRNKRNNTFITYKNETKCLSEWSEITGISKSTLLYRLNNNWDLEKLFTPITRK